MGHKAPSKKDVRELVHRGRKINTQVDKLTPDQIEVLVNSIFSFLRDLQMLIVNGNNKLTPGIKPRNQFPPTKTVIECINQLLKHLNGHVDKFGLCHDDIDYYKIAAWLGMFLIKNTSSDVYGVEENDVVMTMAFEMEAGDGRRLDRESLYMVTDMLKNDGIEDEHGIGKNGLYLIFRAAAKSEIVNENTP